MDETTVQKIARMTDNIGMVYSGMGPDFRVLVRKGRKKAQEYYQYYKDPIPVTQLVRELAIIMQEYTQSGYIMRSLLLSLFSSPTFHPFPFFPSFLFIYFFSNHRM
jgi:20S proteasome subunit alpha 2